MNKFDDDYFYGKKKSNSSNCEKMNAYNKFRTFLEFITEERISGRFLEVRYAFGYLLEKTAPFFTEVCGCDISEFVIEKARDGNPDMDLRVVDIEQGMPYADESFDCIAAMDVLEHTESFEDSLRKIVANLKRLGNLMMSSPIDAWPRKLFGRFDMDETHVSTPTRTGLESSFESTI